MANLGMSIIRFFFSITYLIYLPKYYLCKYNIVFIVFIFFTFPLSVIFTIIII